METPVEAKQVVERHTIAALKFEQQMDVLQEASLTDFLKGAAEVAHYSSLACLGPAVAWMQIERTRNQVTEETATRRVRSYFKEGIIHIYYDDVVETKGWKSAFTNTHVSYDPRGNEEPQWEIEEKTFSESTQNALPFYPTQEQELEFRAHVIEAFRHRREENIRRCRQFGSRANMIVMQASPAYL